MLRILKSYDLPFHTVFKTEGQIHSDEDQDRFTKQTFSEMHGDLTRKDSHRCTEAQKLWPQEKAPSQVTQASYTGINMVHPLPKLHIHILHYTGPPAKSLLQSFLDAIASPST